MKRRRSARLSALQQKKEIDDVFMTVFMENQGVFEAICGDDRLKEFNTSRNYIYDLWHQTKDACTTKLYNACENGNLSAVKELAQPWAAQINAPVTSERKFTPLIAAITSRRKAVVKYLLELPDIDVNQVCANGEFALYQAIQSRISDSDFLYIDMLLAHPKINVTQGSILVNSSGYADEARNCVFNAALDNEDQVLKRLLRHPTYEVEGNPKNWKLSPFLVACSLGHLEVVETFVHESPDFDLSNYKSCDAVPLILACESGNVELIEYLLDLGADPKDWNSDSSMNQDRSSYLVAAAVFNRTKVLQFLLDDERFEITPLDKQLALNGACREKCMSAVNFLLTHAEVELDHPELLTDAIRHASIVTRLLKEEKLVVPIAPITMACCRLYTAQLQMLLDDPRGAVHRFAQNDKGELPMMYLARNTCAKAVTALRSAFLSHPDFQVNQTNGAGNTLLTVAIINQNWKVFDYLIALDDLDVNIQNAEGYYPFHYFVEWKYNNQEDRYLALMKNPRADLSLITDPSSENKRKWSYLSHCQSYLTVALRPQRDFWIWKGAVEYFLQHDSLPASAVNQKLRLYHRFVHPLWKLAGTSKELLQKMIDHPNFVAPDDIIPRPKYNSLFFESVLMMLEQGIVTPSDNMMDVACFNEHVDLTRNLVFHGIELPEHLLTPRFKEALQVKKPKSAATSRALPEDP